MPHQLLKEALHYVIANCPDPSRLGAIRLNKILWFADSTSYRLEGVGITGDTYVKRKFGPVPRHVLAALRELESEGKIVTREVPYTTRKSYREFVSLVEPSTQSLSENGRSWLKAWSKILCEKYTAQEASDMSHDQVWEAADDGEEIPLYTVFASQAGAITDEVRGWANGILAEKLAA
ncbi:Panacea domain-containing protein [Novosphingobium nitrogenifigens]|uniref:Panacea domain-containing protein n=1 Tax=Novosphingobium nitrogenifigens TaxID=378548 RepID=UPI0012F485DF|nr:Panacea domain-containing protein [Novosphingobium nitrogenifigens]